MTDASPAHCRHCGTSWHHQGRCTQCGRPWHPQQEEAHLLADLAALAMADARPAPQGRRPVHERARAHHVPVCPVGAGASGRATRGTRMSSCSGAGRSVICWRHSPSISSPGWGDQPGAVTGRSKRICRRWRTCEIVTFLERKDPMDILSVLIYLIVLCGVAAILWWAMSHFALPQPIMIVVVCVIAVVCLILLFQLLPVGGARPLRLR